MNLLTVLILVLIVLVLSGSWGYRAGWYTGGPYYPYGFGLGGVILLVLILLLLLGRI